MVNVYFCLSTSNIMILTAKDYFDITGTVANSANGRNGVVDFIGEPYNYYSEISSAMHELGCSNVLESSFSIGNMSVADIIVKMQGFGFNLIYNDVIKRGIF